MRKKLLYMQVEDEVVSFETDDREVIQYSVYLVPPEYKRGDIIWCDVTAHGTSFYIDFTNAQIDKAEMLRRKTRIDAKARGLRNRIKRHGSK